MEKNKIFTKLVRSIAIVVILILSRMRKSIMSETLFMGIQVNNEMQHIIGKIGEETANNESFGKRDGDYHENDVERI